MFADYLASVTHAPCGGSTFKPPSTLLGARCGETNALHLLSAKAALSQIRGQTLIGSQDNYEKTDILLQDNDIL